jgi:hypothetical protein
VVKRTAIIVSWVLFCGCDLSPVTTPTGGIGGGDAGTGGASTGGSATGGSGTGGSGADGGMGDAGGGDAGPDGGALVCPHALVVTDSDYTSTNISVLSTAGSVLSASFVSSASAPVGLTTALSGDVVSPLAIPPSGALVLVDRGNNAIDWFNPSTAAVEAQLSVSTGFTSDPHDYLEVAPGKAYVTRYESNATPGMAPFDGGGDILILDTVHHTITGRIDLSDADDGNLEPRPDRMLLVGGQVWVSLERLDASYTTAGDARIAGVDPTMDKRTFELDLPNLVSCGGLALSPSGTVVAMTCSGTLADPSDTSQSSLVLIDPTKSPPVELMRYPVAADQGGALGPTLAFASETLLVGFTYGDTAKNRNDVAFTLDLTSGTVTKLVDAGAAFVLGDVRCTPGCGDRCAMADAQANGLRFWQLTGGALVAGTTVDPDMTVGLPPRGLGEL